MILYCQGIAAGDLEGLLNRDGIRDLIENAQFIPYFESDSSINPDIAKVLKNLMNGSIAIAVKKSIVKSSDITKDLLRVSKVRRAYRRGFSVDLNNAFTETTDFTKLGYILSGENDSALEKEIRHKKKLKL